MLIENYLNNIGLFLIVLYYGMMIAILINEKKVKNFFIKKALDLYISDVKAKMYNYINPFNFGKKYITKATNYFKRKPKDDDYVNLVYDNTDDFTIKEVKLKNLKNGGYDHRKNKIYKKVTFVDSDFQKIGKLGVYSIQSNKCKSKLKNDYSDNNTIIDWVKVDDVNNWNIVD